MKTAKHFALVALFVFGTAAPPMAAKPVPLYPVGDQPNASGTPMRGRVSTFPLYPVGDEPNASGNVWVNYAKGIDVRVSCKELTPGETYVAYDWGVGYLGEFVANKNGMGTIDWTSVDVRWMGLVYIVRADGTLVLSTWAP